MVGFDLKEVEVDFGRGGRQDQEALVDQGFVDDLAILFRSSISTHGCGKSIGDSKFTLLSANKEKARWKLVRELKSEWKLLAISSGLAVCKLVNDNRHFQQCVLDAYFPRMLLVDVIVVASLPHVSLLPRQLDDDFLGREWFIQEI